MDRPDEDDDGDADMDDFIEYEDEDEGGAGNEAAREARRQERKVQNEERRKRRGTMPVLSGVDANAWEEMHDVFGDGHDYDWALELDEGMVVEQPEMRVGDVFEPSEIKDRFLTEDDDIIRNNDMPERMQLATAAFSPNSSLSLHQPLSLDDLPAAATWITTSLSSVKTVDYFSPNGKYANHRVALVMAVSFVLERLFIDHLEVPYIYYHKRDNLRHYNTGNDSSEPLELLNMDELWKIYQLGQKYRSLLQRKNALEASYQQYHVRDNYFEDEIRNSLDSLEVVGDAQEWLMMKYKGKKDTNEFRFAEDEFEEGPTRKHKAPSRVSAYEVMKKSPAGTLAKLYGIDPHEVVLNFNSTIGNPHYVNNHELAPQELADQYVDPDPAKAVRPEEILRQARHILVTELAKDPLLRKAVREEFKAHAVVSVSPTEKGKVKIDENHPAYSFKYLKNKPIAHMIGITQFAHIMDAERQMLVNASFALSPDKLGNLESRLREAFNSDSFDGAAQAWNAERARIVSEVFQQHLLPMGAKWVREYLRDAVEDYIADAVGYELKQLIDVAPYRSSRSNFGEVVPVLAVSWGNGNPQKDDISLVFMDELGRMRESTKIANLYDKELKDEFFDLLRRRKPHVVVVGGWTMATSKLSARLKEVIETGPNGDDPEGRPNTEFQGLEVIYGFDQVARLYMQSARSKEEFPSFNDTDKYCVGLARYCQSPLNEFAALGPDMTMVRIYASEQHLCPISKLHAACERSLVEVTAKVGVDINRAVTDPYYRLLLPFIAGLGPRKAEQLVEKISKMNSEAGSLNNRSQLVTMQLLPPQIFLNAAGFLRIHQDNRPSKHNAPLELAQDPLDDTRIHPQDYDLARKMAMDALELDEEDTQDDHPSHVVRTIMLDPMRGHKLNELNIEAFAQSLATSLGDYKRQLLFDILDELQNPFAEKRQPWKPMDGWTVLTSLSSETNLTLSKGFIIPVQVTRVRDGSALVRLSSGIEGTIAAEAQLPKPHTTVRALIVDVKVDEAHDEFSVELSTEAGALAEGDEMFRRVNHDDYWDTYQSKKDAEMLQRKKRAETQANRRTVQHPHFHNFNAGQAETYLEQMQRGDVVIRPSSKGNDHLAITWKVDQKLYQHIDATEVNGNLEVDPKHVYSDLDDLIVNHVQALARRVEDLMNHERYKARSEDELHQFLKQQLAANPAKSMYGFTLNRRKPGHFVLCFLANKQATVQTWPVRVSPEAYYLFEAVAPGVSELCDAFKVRHLHQQNQAAQGAGGGRTPYGAGMGRTPGHASVRQPGATPNPYGGATPRGFGAPTGGGWGQPNVAPAMPSGMNPARAAMIQQGSTNGWGQ
ncbi:hypothetical protein CYLTODRAFT_63573 [Cylindrobasidium torrendii FP15055 ss-10]|uniref:Transcription elongation factor SPT6 n=1 Tax=Cylindrobasidium torrendii FP15055 ss-10 TaxID=1314674 RepID=A0A0D7BPU7_9AGAR|nr:hypothetical protein CYLTODRAFT_63573 [Cylindrobasidium torrendii FP15055 ss-10]